MQEVTKLILEKLDKVRDKINENSNYIILKYSYLNNKDFWNLTCSAMDWIDVAKNNIDSDKIENKNNLFVWKDLYIYLSSVDIIINAIIQLYRVFFETENELLFGDTTIFKGEYLNKSDYEYFKHIRAIFGAHPMDIKENCIRKFASWPVSGLYEEEYTCLLYSSEKNQDSMGKFGFNTIDVNKLLLKYVNYLDNIYAEIDNRKLQFDNKKKQQKIKKVENTLEQIDILIGENNKRLNYEYIDETLNTLKIIFSVAIKNEENFKLVEKYRELLKIGLNELYNVIQDMNLEKLDNLKLDSLLNPEYRRIENFGYAYGKLTSMVSVPNYEYPFQIIENDIYEQIKTNIILEWENYDELYVLVMTSLYFQRLTEEELELYKKEQLERSKLIRKDLAEQLPELKEILLGNNKDIK